MATPSWLLDAFAAFMLVAAVVSAARLVMARQWQREPSAIGVDAAHLLMAVAMAGMLAPGLGFLPSAGWEVAFGLLTAWFAWRAWLESRGNGLRALAGGHCAPHLVHAAAMLYMYLALPVPAGGQGGAGMMRTLAHPTVAFAFALALLGYSAWDLDRLPGMWHGLIGARASLAPAGLPAAVAAPSGPLASGDRSTTDAPPASEDVPAGASAGGRPGGALLLSPGTLVATRVTLGITMALMLLIMI